GGNAPPLQGFDYNWHIWTVTIYNLYWAACWQDGTLLVEGAPDTSYNQFYIPDVLTAGGFYSYHYTGMDLAEWVIFDRPLANFERVAAEQYLQNKFALYGT